MAAVVFGTEIDHRRQPVVVVTAVTAAARVRVIGPVDTAGNRARQAVAAERSRRMSFEVTGPCGAGERLAERGG